jgi:hypothetical protein
VTAKCPDSDRAGPAFPDERQICASPAREKRPAVNSFSTNHNKLLRIARIKLAHHYAALQND